MWNDGPAATNRVRTKAGLRRGAAAVGGSLVLLLAAGPAMAAPTAGVVTARGCGAPKINAWYDSDQFGTYLKVDFSRKSTCHGRVATIKGEVDCKTTHKRVYYESEVLKNSTITRSLPGKGECKSFWAQGTITYVGMTLNFQDTWQWNWGNYPA